ncbi:MAG: ABC transporter permease [Actinobacteria bacterium]|nr:ABC transporter permease [Actinomycetota bacterium]
MNGLLTVFRKEISDHFSSKRFIVLLALVYLAGLSAVYVALQNIGSELAGAADSEFVFLKLFTSSGEVMPSFIAFIGLFIPIIGIAFGFDAINSERSSGTLSKVLSQPIYRDSVINAKFLAGISTIMVLLGSIVFIIGGVGLRAIGVPPSPEEIIRIFLFIAIGIFYGAFWMGLAILFSIIFERMATSVLVAIAIWLFFTFFMPIIINAIANSIVPITDSATIATILRHQSIVSIMSRFSPPALFTSIIIPILMPQIRTFGPVFATDLQSMLPNPLPLGQSVFLVWPHLTTLVALTIICFAISYVIFMRQEIRST